MRLIDTLDKVYTDAFNSELKRRSGEGYYVVDENSGKRYEGAGFYLCGFNWIQFKYLGKNRALKRQLEKEGVRVGRAYPNGFSFSVPASKFHGNGKYEIESVGYRAVEKYLADQGYDVWHYSNLD